MNGRIIKIDSSTSYVLSKNNVYTAHAKWNLKRETKPCVGDLVTFDIVDEIANVVNITNISERSSELYRPKIVNVDQVVIVTALYEPLFASYILNKYIAMLEVKHIKPILVFTKRDLLDSYEKKDDIFKKIQVYIDADYEVIVLDNKSPKNTDVIKLKNILENKVSVFTGQTGAGKSSTLNNFLKVEDQIKTQEISKNLNRGKHTTTSVKLYPLPKNILIADTPGFSSFELQDIEVEDIIFTFKFFIPYRNLCKFANCQHINEIKCAVKEALIDKKISQFIYDDYLKMIEEIKNRKTKY